MIIRQFASKHFNSSWKTQALVTLLATVSTTFVTNAKASDQQVQMLIKEVLPCLTDIANNSTKIIQEKIITAQDLKVLEDSTLMICRNFLVARGLTAPHVNRESKRVSETKQIQKVIENNLNIANQMLDIEIAEDKLNIAIAQRNPSINISIDYTIRSQNYWKCANNEYLEVGVTCSTVDGLTLESSDSSSSSGASFAAPFNYG